MIFFLCVLCILELFFFKQKTAYGMRMSDWSSDVCSSDRRPRRPAGRSVLHDAGWPARGGLLAAMADPRDETARRPLPGDPVPPLGFGAVEGLVGGLDDGVRLAHGLGPLGDADRDRELQGADPGSEIGRAHV